MFRSENTFKLLIRSERRIRSQTLGIPLSLESGSSPEIFFPVKTGGGGGVDEKNGANYCGMKSVWGRLQQVE